MGAPKGNKYWEFRNKHGRDHKYTPDALWQEALKYFEWMTLTPLQEEKVFHTNGIITKTTVSHMRAMTEISFCLYADICQSTWENYKNEKDFMGVTARIANTIYSQKFEGASADLLNANIIARDLGLKERSEIGHTLKTPPSKIEYIVVEPKKVE